MGAAWAWFRAASLFLSVRLPCGIDLLHATTLPSIILVIIFVRSSPLSLRSCALTRLGGVGE